MQVPKWKPLKWKGRRGVLSQDLGLLGLSSSGGSLAGTCPCCRCCKVLLWHHPKTLKCNRPGWFDFPCIRRTLSYTTLVHDTHWFWSGWDLVYLHSSRMLQRIYGLKIQVNQTKQRNQTLKRHPPHTHPLWVCLPRQCMCARKETLLLNRHRIMYDTVREWQED